jgi:hypothetical protein
MILYLKVPYWVIHKHIVLKEGFCYKLLSQKLLTYAHYVEIPGLLTIHFLPRWSGNQ